MFTGIIEKTSRVLGVSDGPMFRRLTIACEWQDISLGDSVATNGVCLTVADVSADRITFDVIKETLMKTNLGALAAGDEVHLERSLRVGDRFDGHFVQGHIDGTGELINQISTQHESRLRLRVPLTLAKFLAPKGSIAIDGVSLTIALVEGNEFEVALIPTTLQLTNLANRPAGWRFNIECDIISKQVVYWLELQQGRCS
ncbi:MAG: riboflavin synthase [Phycisphaerales bacterium]|nr:riboflavin synthase [Phycisphaerales bacterium]